MSENKHTPGPWLYRPYQHDDWGVVRSTSEVEGSCPIVASARSGGYPTEEELAEHRCNQTDPYEANARLIAAAPDLLEALKSAVRIAEEARREWDATPAGMRAGKILIALSGGCKGYRRDIDAIHAAIAKAEGRSGPDERETAE